MGKQKNIIIIEDDETFSLLITHYLKNNLPGVNVVVKGNTNGTSTDFDGKFRLNNIKSGDVLVFSFVGYLTKEITITTNFNITVNLTEDSEKLDEVVIIGYGSTTIKDATGSVEAITAKDFTKGNIVTPENLLSGRVAGVNITTSGAPGSGSQITIRGGSSLGASNAPLIVIDGLPIDNNSTAGSRGILANINPSDIESFSLLKDASATAIYGSRASNGVIIIVTKKGKREYSLDYDVQYNFGATDVGNLLFTNLVGGTTYTMEFSSPVGQKETSYTLDVLQKDLVLPTFDANNDISFVSTAQNNVAGRIEFGLNAGDMLRVLTVSNLVGTI